MHDDPFFVLFYYFFELHGHLRAVIVLSALLCLFSVHTLRGCGSLNDLGQDFMVLPQSKVG